MAGLSVGERVYREIKHRLLEGEFQPGERLDINALGQTHSASITPVRAALSRLVGEDLLEAQARDGFHRPLVNEQGLRDLYAWNGSELANAVTIASANRVLRAAPARGADGNADLVARTERLFAALAASSRNIICERIIGWLNDHLHAIRRMEAGVIPDVADELSELEQAFAAGQFEALARALDDYHRRRRLKVSDLAAAVHRPDLRNDGEAAMEAAMARLPLDDEGD